MSNPSTADVVSMDYTTLYTIKNLNAIGFGGVDILNMTSTITVKLDIPKDGEIIEEAENISHILKSAETCDKILIAWGKIGESNKKIRLLQLKILEKLRPHEDKLFGITNELLSDQFFHPLAPQIRFEWVLKPLELSKPPPKSEEAKQSKSSKSKKLQESDPPTQESDTAESDQPSA
jgi:hypothetical protein